MYDKMKTVRITSQILDIPSVLKDEGALYWRPASRPTTHDSAPVECLPTRRESNHWTSSLTAGRSWLAAVVTHRVTSFRGRVDDARVIGCHRSMRQHLCVVLSKSSLVLCRAMVAWCEPFI